MVVDWSPTPSSRERAAMQARRKRLEGGLVASSKNAADKLRSISTREPSAGQGFRVREEFSFQSDRPAGHISDRNAPPKPDRPSCTRLFTPSGIALRFYLACIAVAQATKRPGGRFVNDLSIRGEGAASSVGWVDLVASTAKIHGSGETYSTVRDKHVRQIHNALKTLESASLVELPAGGKGARKYDGFVVLNEVGGRAAGVPPEYSVPKKAERTFSLPSDFIDRGWVHVLEDTEIAILLMLACGRDSIGTPPQVAIPAISRVLNYGISKESFQSHRTLERLGLIVVEEVARHDDGRAVEFVDEGAQLNRLALRPAGFAEDAGEMVLETIKYQLGR